MESRHSPLIIVLLVVLGVAVLGGIGWASNQVSTRDSAGGLFKIEWIGVRARVVDGISPYSNTVSDRIQTQVQNLFDWAPAPKPTYTSPLYSAVISLPFALIADAQLAQAAWLALQLIVILGTFLLLIRIVDWKPSWWLLFVVFLIVLFGLRNVVSWYEGSMMIWVAGLVFSTLLLIREKRYELAGGMLALAMMRPQAVILWVLFALLWAGSHRKWVVIVWFLTTLALLIGAFSLLVPGWPIQYLRILWNYGDYFSPGTPGFAFSQWWPGLGQQMGWVLSGILTLALIFEWRLALRRDFSWFLWTSCLTITVSSWMGIPVSPDIHVLLNLPLLFLLAMFDGRWRRGGKWVALAAAFIILAWEWWIVLSGAGNLGSTAHIGLMFPFPLLLCIGLFWVRWWSIKPKKLLIDELRASGNL